MPNPSTRVRRVAVVAAAATVVAGFISSVAAAPVSTIDGAAAGAAVATRGSAVQVTPTQPPPPNPCAPPAGVPGSARQVVIVDANGTFASVDLRVKVGAEWTCARSDMTGRVGRTGVHPLASRVAGDGSTPGGIFPLGTMTAPDGQTFQFFGNGTNPGVQGTWRQVRAGDCWDATGGDASYNTLTSRPASQCTGDDEYLPSITGAYSRAALIGANMGPDRSGDEPGETPRAAAIFLHRFSYDAAGRSKPTSGCVSLAATDLAAVLRALVPGEAWFVITS